MAIGHGQRGLLWCGTRGPLSFDGVASRAWRRRRRRRKRPRKDMASAQAKLVRGSRKRGRGASDCRKILQVPNGAGPYVSPRKENMEMASIRKEISIDAR